MEHGGPGTPASTENEDVKKLRHDIECTQRTLEGLTQYCEELVSGKNITGVTLVNVYLM